MPYINRDESGNISGIFKWPTHESQEFIPDDSAELQPNLLQEEIDNILSELSATDKKMPRIGEEAIEILINGGGINPVNLSQEARDILQRRKELRALLATKQAQL